MPPSKLLLSCLMLSATSVANSHEVPVGDGRIADHAQSGYVFACQTRFRAGGARHVGEWFHGETWDPDAKPHVAGEVVWPQAHLELRSDGASISVQGNGLPLGQPTGRFPIAPDDPAYRYDTNPNSIEPQAWSFALPARPLPASDPGCLPMGMIGFTTTGVALFNALDAAGRDAAAHEVQDACDGHPERAGQFHYHSGSPCIPGDDADALVGWALDGYPIFGRRDADGHEFGNGDLDACHGRVEPHDIDGRHYDYAYRITAEYPYTLGCFHGRVPDASRQATHRRMPPSARP